MKKIYTLIIITATLMIFPIFKANATDSIPNAGFEVWQISSWFEFPAMWQTNNTQLLAPTVVKDTNSYSGNYDMLLNYEGALTPHAWCDFHLNSHPYNMGAYILNHLNPNDSLVIVIRIFYNQQIVDSGYSVIYGGINPNYMHFVTPISQNSTNADSCEISFEGGTMFSSSLYIDDLQFDIIQGLPQVNNAGFTIYPNPCTSHVFLDFGNSNFIPSDIEAVDITGRRIKFPAKFDNNWREDYIVELNTESLISGTWFVVIQNDEQKYKVMLVKN